ncbi:MAG: hypothetical protein AAFQ67_00370 [Pseudomonadota bacterium]
MKGTSSILDWCAIALISVFVAGAIIIAATTGIHVQAGDMDLSVRLCSEKGLQVVFRSINGLV